ncbi:MAG: TlpA disulfide reductase family protein, partial [Planctomycetota bacterium]
MQIQLSISTAASITFLLVQMLISISLEGNRHHQAVTSDWLAGTWKASIQCPGGEIQFGLEFQQSEQNWNATIINGPERISVPSTQVSANSVTLSIDHYDSVIRLMKKDHKMTGIWKKRKAKTKWTQMVVSANRLTQSGTNDLTATRFTGKWKVDFSKSDSPAVGIFQIRNDRMLGTFLTTTGDYRFLDGTVQDKKMSLSCFDGAHAFLFDATLNSDGKLIGNFWSSDSWHESWTAVRDRAATLPDDFKQTSWDKEFSLGDLAFPNLDNQLISLEDQELNGKARIIYLFGSWCPNCHDAAKYMSELDQTYGEQGLKILGLAFEHTGDFSRDAEQVRKYLHRNHAKYPVLLAGLSDKSKASAKIPLIDRVRSYPTTLFLNSDNQIVAVHTGFTGPATGESYQN